MHIDIKLGLSCNSACRHCIMEPVRRNLLSEDSPIDTDSEGISNILEKVIAHGATSVTLTGGEPTLRKDFYDILERLMGTNLLIYVQTNGRLLSRKENVARLAAMPGRNAQFVIALHGPDAATHDTITRRKGSFDETTAAIRSILSLGFELCGKIVLSRYNIHCLAETLDLMENMGVREIVVAYPHAEDFTPEAKRDIMPTYDETGSAIRRATSRKRCSTITWETIPLCVLPQSERSRSCDLGFLAESIEDEHSFIEMTMMGSTIDWETSRREIKTHFPVCRQCLLEKVCEGAWDEYAEVHGCSGISAITDAEEADALVQAIL